MSAPRPCEHCGTMLDTDGYYSMLVEAASPHAVHYDDRCIGVLRAQLAERTRQRDEAIRELERVHGRLATGFYTEALEVARAALERLRHE